MELCDNKPSWRENEMNGDDRLQPTPPADSDSRWQDETWNAVNEEVDGEDVLKMNGIRLNPPLKKSETPIIPNGQELVAGSLQVRSHRTWELKSEVLQE